MPITHTPFEPDDIDSNEELGTGYGAHEVRPMQSPATSTSGSAGVGVDVASEGEQQGDVGEGVTDVSGQPSRGVRLPSLRGRVRVSVCRSLVGQLWRN